MSDLETTIIPAEVRLREIHAETDHQPGMPVRQQGQTNVSARHLEDKPLIPLHPHSPQDDGAHTEFLLTVVQCVRHINLAASQGSDHDPQT